MANPVSIDTGLVKVFAAGKVVGATGAYATSGAGANAQVAAWGAAGAITRVGAGSYTIALAGGGIDPATCIIEAQVDGTGATNTQELQITQTSDVLLTILTFSAGAAADKNFWFRVMQFGR